MSRSLVAARRRDYCSRHVERDGVGRRPGRGDRSPGAGACPGSRRRRQASTGGPGHRQRRRAGGRRRDPQHGRDDPPDAAGAPDLPRGFGPESLSATLGAAAQGNTDIEVVSEGPLATPPDQFLFGVADDQANEPDRPMIAADPFGPPENRSLQPIYVAYTANPPNGLGQPLRVATSTLGDLIFTTPTAQVWNSGGDIGAWPAVAADETVYVVWDDYCGLTPQQITPTAVCPKPGGQILISKSPDFGSTWSGTPAPNSATTTGFGSVLPNYAPDCTQGCPVRPINPSPQLAIDNSGGP